ncbi:magnesium-dependent phosphatase 1-like [Cylas formicarius]|uniref:magnesium-dependent phosphatase 1-like n=1 Tax=Cylas formicarius TaxID=197179 RepID=UPI002958B798|nr:magnesium-dependent phosphatase 1-like [Cylas formicarius]
MTSSTLKIIVFDLDYTLWPFWVDTHVNPPFRKQNGKIFDSYGSQVQCYPEVPSVLQDLKEQGYELGIASRTGEIKGARQLIELFGWDRYFKYKEIFPGCKVTHFRNIQKASGKSFSEMLFFDDEHRNISDLSNLGVTSILVHNGVNKKVVDDGIRQFATERN